MNQPFEMIKSNYSISFIFALLFLACKDEGPVFAGCCNNPAINTIVGNSRVFMANVFTPNNDGRNDRLQVYGDSIERIALMEIRNKENEVVFTKTNFLPGDPGDGWDGEVDGNVEEGLYDFTIQLETTDGTVEVLQGKVCNYPCNEAQTDKLDATNCQFPSQVNDGQFDPTIPSGETNDCFE